MSRRDPDLEIIELLPVDDRQAAWSRNSGPSVPAVAARGRGRRGAVLGSVAIVGAIIAVAIATSGNDTSSHPPATSSTQGGVATTTPRLTPTEPAADGLFVVDTPSLRPYSADITSPPDEREAFWLWTSPTATAVMSVHIAPSPAASVVFVDSTRRVVTGLDLVSPNSDPSITHVVVDLGGLGSATVTATGLTDAQIVGLALGLVVNDTASITDTSDVMAAVGLQVTAKAHTQDELLQRAARSEARYLDAAGEVITLDVADGDVRSSVALLNFLATDVVSTADGRTVGTLLGTGQSIVLWEAGGHLLSLTAPLAPLELLDVSHHVRGAGVGEWTALVSGLRPDFRLGDYAQLANGAAPDGSHWRAGVQRATRGGRARFLWWWTLPGSDDTASVLAAEDLTRGPVVDTVVVAGATYVFVSRLANPNADTVTVTGADGRSVVLPLQHPFADQPILIGVARIDAPGPVSVTP